VPVLAAPRAAASREDAVIKLVTFLKRRDGESRADFQSMWIAEHAPRAAIFPGLRGYVVNLAEGEDAPADALAELWFDDRNAVQTAYASEIGRQGSAHSRSHTSRREHIYAQERMLRGARPPEQRWKLVLALKRHDGTDRQGFFAFLDSSAAPGLLRLPGLLAAGLDTDDGQEVLNSGTEGQLDALRQEGVFDALLVAWFADAAALRGAAGSAEWSALLRMLAPHAGRIEPLRLAERRIV
jgi:uncharacterized protein (TIGR02118 family)